MRASLLRILRCPRCATDASLRLRADLADELEVRHGSLSCERCSARFRVVDGIADLLVDAPGFVVRESDGLDRFAEVMRADGWDGARLRALPDVGLPYWHGQRRAMDSLLARVALQRGQRLLDVGSNTCWASNAFAARGLDVVALDIAMNDLQGLRAASHFIGRDGTFFERVRSVMFAPALASGSLDYVFCCEVLHHNDRAHLRRTFRELHRVLADGGRLFVVNEPLRFPLNLKREHAREVAEFDGNEHVYFLHEYYLAARSAGFAVQVPALSRGRGARRGVGSIWRHMVAGDTPLVMDCRKLA